MSECVRQKLLQDRDIEADSTHRVGKSQVLASRQQPPATLFDAAAVHEDPAEHPRGETIHR